MSPGQKKRNLLYNSLLSQASSYFLAAAQGKFKSVKQMNEAIWVNHPHHNQLKKLRGHYFFLQKYTLSHTGDLKIDVSCTGSRFLGKKIKSVKELKQEIQAVVDSPDLERTDFSEVWEEEED